MKPGESEVLHRGGALGMDFKRINQSLFSKQEGKAFQKEGVASSGNSSAA